MDPLLLDIPSEFYTERLYIRVPQPGDGKKVYESMLASMNELKPWVPFANIEQSYEKVEASARNAFAKFIAREDMRLHIYLKDNNEYIGCSGLHGPNWKVRKFEIGYWIDSRFSGNGYMTEAVNGICEFAFNELKANRVEIKCDSLNVKSRAIPEKLGFTLEGIIRNDDISVDGKEIRDTCIFAKVRDKAEIPVE